MLCARRQSGGIRDRARVEPPMGVRSQGHVGQFAGHISCLSAATADAHTAPGGRDYQPAEARRAAEVA